MATGALPGKRLAWPQRGEGPRQVVKGFQRNARGLSCEGRDHERSGGLLRHATVNWHGLHKKKESLALSRGFRDFDWPTLYKYLPKK